MKRAQQINVDTQGYVYVRVPSEHLKINYKQMKMHILKRMILLLVGIVTAGSLMAQGSGPGTITGTVTDTNGEPLIGVNIVCLMII